MQAFIQGEACSLTYIKLGSTEVVSLTDLKASASSNWLKEGCDVNAPPYVLQCYHMDSASCHSSACRNSLWGVVGGSSAQFKMFQGDPNLALASQNMQLKANRATNGHVQTSFFDRLDTAKKRSPSERVGAQFMMRLKYLLLSWFGLKPFLWYLNINTQIFWSNLHTWMLSILFCHAVPRFPHTLHSCDPREYPK